MSWYRYERLLIADVELLGYLPGCSRSPYIRRYALLDRLSAHKRTTAHRNRSLSAVIAIRVQCRLPYDEACTSHVVRSTQNADSA